MEETHLLEINLISAQGLKPPSANLRRMQTYALAWVDPSFKLRTRVDRIGGENPTWNDKFLFRVSSDFLSKETSAVSIEIYTIGYLKDPLIGTVRFLIGGQGVTSPGTGVGFGVPSFSALQIRRGSGKFQGLLNIGSMVINSSDISVLTGISAVGYRDLMGDSSRKRKKSSRRQASNGEELFADENNSSWGDTDSNSSTSSTSTASTVLMDWNGRRDLAGNYKDRMIDGAALLCGLGFQRKDSSESFRSEIGDEQEE